MNFNEGYIPTTESNDRPEPFSTLLEFDPYSRTEKGDEIYAAFIAANLADDPKPAEADEVQEPLPDSISILEFTIRHAPGIDPIVARFGDDYIHHRMNVDLAGLPMESSESDRPAPESDSTTLEADIVPAGSRRIKAVCRGCKAETRSLILEGPTKEPGATVRRSLTELASSCTCPGENKYFVEAGQGGTDVPF